MAFHDPLIHHLLRRAGFGLSAAESDEYSERGFLSTVDELLNYSSLPDDVDSRIGTPGYAGTTSNGEFSPSTVINDARQRWLFRMVHSRRPLQEKMALFWHNHFATAYSKVSGNTSAAEATRMMAAKPSEHPGGLRGQLEIFRDFALGNFRDLLIEVAKDPAMIVWLDGRTNVRTRPQENFAREIMELFTMGVGNYTEADVYAGARVFTGWNLQRVGPARDPGTYWQFFYNANQHDTSAKEFTFAIYPDGGRTIPSRSGSQGMQDGIDLINALARHPETGRRLARKLWSFFVSELEAPNEGLVDRMASEYLRSNFSIGAMMRTLLSSQDFINTDAFFARYSWPVEFVARALKEVGYAGFSLSSALTPLTNMGQQLFEPPDVAGWDLGATWFSTGSMLARMNFAATLTSNQRFNISRDVRGKGPTPDALLSFYLDRLTPASYESGAYNDLLAYLQEGGTWTGSDAQLATKAPGLLHLIVGSSEYQFV